MKIKVNKGAPDDSTRAWIEKNAERLDYADSRPVSDRMKQALRRGEARRKQSAP